MAEDRRIAENRRQGIESAKRAIEDERRLSDRRRQAIWEEFANEERPPGRLAQKMMPTSDPWEGMSEPEAADFKDFVSEPVGQPKGSAVDYWNKQAEGKGMFSPAAYEDTANATAKQGLFKTIGSEPSVAEAALGKLGSIAGKLGSLGAAYGVVKGGMRAFDINKEGGSWPARFGKTVENLMGYPAGTSGRLPTKAEDEAARSL